MNIEGLFTLITDVSVPYKYRPFSATHAGEWFYFRYIWRCFRVGHRTDSTDTEQTRHLYVTDKCESTFNLSVSVCLDLPDTQPWLVSNKAKNCSFGYNKLSPLAFPIQNSEAINPLHTTGTTADRLILGCDVT
jgi:hypothetical protein